MRRSNILKIFCVVAIFMATVMLVPTLAKAEGERDYVGEEGIFYSTEFNIKDYWEKGKAPIIEDCVFGGWYQKVDNTYKALTEEDAAVAEDAYAKFVPAYVLSVKAQNEYGTKADTEETSVRIMTSVDSKSYQTIGFEVYLANRIPLYKNDNQDPLETTRVYDGILVNEQEKYATDIFGAASRYVGVWKLTDIIKDNYEKIIYVRPYWITKDGTKVEGLAKYVHIEDDYMGYISVPVNILNKEDTAKIAAGRVEMTYTNANEGETVALTFKEVEEGRLLPEMKTAQSGNAIKMVGNAKDVDKYNSTETLYANVRFQKPQDTETKDVDVNFNINMVQFCDWYEETVTIEEKWDVKYDVQETTSE